MENETIGYLREKFSWQRKLQEPPDRRVYDEFKKQQKNINTSEMKSWSGRRYNPMGTWILL